MASANREYADNDQHARIIIHKTTLILLAVAINAAEFFIPRIPFFPWLKPGLANCVTILWIAEFGVVDALLFSLLRIWIVGFYFGFSFYTVSLGLSGAICSTLAMGLMWAALGKRGWIGTVGVGIIGALVHNLTQITVIYFLLAKNVHLFYQVPLMIIASIVFGSITGGLAPTLLDFLKNARIRLPTGSLTMHGAGERLRVRDTLVSVFVFIAACAVALVNKASILALCAMASTLFVQLLHRGSLKALLLPVSRFWLMFLFIACIHGFLSYGTTIEAFPLVTYEGARLIGVQWLKLWTWLELSFILTHFNFHIVALKLLTRVFPNNQSSLFSGAIALECFPIIVGSVQKKVKSRWRWCARHPVAGMRKSFTFIYREIERLLFAQP